MTVALLVQIDKLVMLIESPVFTCESLSNNNHGILFDLCLLQLYDCSFWNRRNTRTCSNACTAYSCYCPKAVHSYH